MPLAPEAEISLMAAGPSTTTLLCAAGGSGNAAAAVGDVARAVAMR